MICSNFRKRTNNDSIYDLSPNSRPNWWQKKIERKPTFVVNDEPIGTGGQCKQTNVLFP